MAVCETWKTANATAKARIAFLLDNESLSDVRLVVRSSSDESGAKKSKMAIPAHKLVLSLCSPVFFAMFFGKLAETSDSIEIPDCEYEGVLEMLRYMYSEEVKLNERNVMQVLYVAKKYLLPSLADECVAFLQRNLDSTNVFCVLIHARRFDENALVQRCWELIDRDTEDVLKSEGFVDLQRSLLEDIVRRDSLTITEVVLFKAVDLWATKECERQGLAVEGKAKRRILGERIFKELRFPAMEEREFASVVVDCNILTRTEKRELMKYFNREFTTPLRFLEVKRIGSCQSCCRFGSFHSLNEGEDEGWCYDEDEDGWPPLHAVKFWVDKDVELHGIRLFGGKCIKYGLSMKIVDQQNLEAILIMEKQYFSSVPLPYKAEEIDGFDVMFDPFVLTKNRVYVVRAYVYGQESCFGSGGVSNVECCGVTFYFKNYKSSKNETSVDFGQFAEFFFKPM